MNVTCPECRSIFRVDPAKVPASGVRARCSVCGGIFPVAVEHRTQAAAGERRPTPVTASVAVPTPSAGAPRQPTPATAGPAVSHPGAPPANPVAPAAEAPSAPLGGVDAPSAAPTPPPAPAMAAEPAPPAPSEPPKETAIWGSPAAVPAQRFVAPPSIGGDPSPAPTAATANSLTPQGVPVIPAAVVPPAPPAATPPADAAPRRPVNPYLSNDPNQKARRLARALVSDLIAYHPQKREEGLRAGTLKQLFRDEIRKSWEEYVEQVGAPLAESTPHFQDALNDLLAGGRKVF
jgi:predicted Zn finger-like uncharacterized protein